MEGKSTGEKLGILLKHIKEMSRLKNLFRPQLEGNGLINAATLMTNRDRVISEVRKYKAMQWSLHCIDPKVKAGILKRGLIQSLITIIPHVCIYFATEGEVQTRLLSAYVSKLVHMYDSSSIQVNQPLYHRKVYWDLSIIFNRHLELKRLYMDNEELITSVGLKYIIPGIFSYTCNLFEFVQVILRIINNALNQSSFQWRNYYREICKLPWYTWTVANRKTYLLILMGSSKTTKIRIINQISVNYNLLMQIFKYLYTSGNAARNLYKKKGESR
ncbi:uncharacterized protein [Euwallacea similis]|uniref:uncharacterized protein n=1 Tax=Euwallacea similis TaxID=1736056 RepID=UPI00344CEC82